jgi:NADPH:quinone reductase-like Zn-dependent oxidoreductase
MVHQKFFLEEVEKPIPKNNEVLVKVHATTVTAGDVRMRSFSLPSMEWLFLRLYLGLRKPRRPLLGMEIAVPPISILLLISPVNRILVLVAGAATT